MLLMMMTIGMGGFGGPMIHTTMKLNLVDAVIVANQNVLAVCGLAFAP
tara:strand:+ start:755 stop:898 length:144 start_codon:yes stop_codon:yes gene_type:complete